jgi:2-hydroxychromene-2-carboxylate isomerase
MADEDTFFETLKVDGLDEFRIKEIISSQACKDELIQNTQNAVDKGVFGIPTFIYANEIFFGKDHLDQLEDVLKS